MMSHLTSSFVIFLLSSWTSNIFCQVGTISWAKCKFIVEDNHSLIQIHISPIDHKSVVNEKLMNLTIDSNNKTHYGAIYMDFYQDFTSILFRFKVEVNRQKFMEQAIDLCKWAKNPKSSYLINLFKSYVKKFFNEKLFDCPYKKGFLIAAVPREKTIDATSFYPSFVPVSGNLTLTIIFQTKILGRIENLFRTVEMFKFV